MSWEESPLALQVGLGGLERVVEGKVLEGTEGWRPRCGFA